MRNKNLCSVLFYGAASGHASVQKWETHLTHYVSGKENRDRWSQEQVTEKKLIHLVGGWG